MPDGYAMLVGERGLSTDRSIYVHAQRVGMPEGYVTLVGERGLKLSGREKQRVALGACLPEKPLTSFCVY
jgi:ABC-type transport system involved in Fe-S cluster assembly fused permease/ATPase subunit